MNPRDIIDLLPSYLQDISEDIYRSSLPEWMKSTMGSHLVRAFSQFCMSVGEDKVDPDQEFFFSNLLWVRQHKRFVFVPTDRCAKRVFLKQLQKALMGSETDHVPTLNSVLETYGKIILTVNGWRGYCL